MFATSGRAELAYDVTGERASGGHDVLLLHAGVTDMRSWQPVVDRLAGRHRCIRFDARGYGQTRYQREGGWSPVSDAVAVLDAAESNRAVVVAGSMGGATAIDLALAHPERVTGLVLIGSAVRGAPYPDITEGATARLTALGDAAEEAEDIDELNRIEAWMWLDGPAAEEGRVGGELRALFLEMNGRALAAEDPGDKADAPDAWPRLAEITVPALVLAGRLDTDEILPISRQLARELGNARLLLLDGVAHLPHLEGDPATLAAISDFVDGVSL
jgi:pimeloyl-ACP methyl ester carboxylesterase